MAVVSELVTRFSFIGDLKPQATFNENLSQGIKLSAAFAGAVVAGAGAFLGWNSSILAGLDPMIQLSRQTGVAIGEIQKLGYVASVNGSSADALQSSLSGLNKTIGEAARWTGPGIEHFQRLGISVRDASGQLKGADTILDDVRQRFNQLNLSMAERQSIAGALGIDPSLIQMLSLTNEQMGSLSDKAQKLGVLTKQNADDAAAFNDSLTTLKFAFSGIQNMIAVGFAPQLKALTDRFVNFLAVNQDTIINGIQWFGEAITTLAASITRLLPVIGIIAAAFGVWKIATIGLGTALGIAFSPVTLIVLGLAALLLVIDDLMVAMEGGQSVIADFFSEFFGIDIVSILTELGASFKEWIGGWQKDLDYLFSAESISDGFLRGFEIVSRRFMLMVDSFKNLWRSASEYIRSAAVDLLPDWAIKLLDFSANAVNYSFNVVGGALSSFADWSGLTSALGPQSGVLPQSQALSMGGTGSSVSNTIEQKNEFNIVAPSPEAAAQAVSGTLQQQLDTAEYSFNRGGR